MNVPGTVAIAKDRGSSIGGLVGVADISAGRRIFPPWRIWRISWWKLERYGFAVNLLLHEFEDFAQRFGNQPVVTKHIKKQEKPRNRTWKKYKIVIFTESLLGR